MCENTCNIFAPLFTCLIHSSSSCSFSPSFSFQKLLTYETRFHSKNNQLFRTIRGRTVTRSQHQTQRSTFSRASPSTCTGAPCDQSLDPRFTDESFFKISLRPFTLLCSPVVAWGTLVNGTTDSWSESLAHPVLRCSTNNSSITWQLWPFPSRFHCCSRPQNTDITSNLVLWVSGVGSLFSAIVGNALAGPLSDWSVTFLSRHNKGIYEPECVFRCRF